MSLRQIRVVFYLAIIALALTIDCIGGAYGWVVAAVVVGGAIPMFRAIAGAAERRGVNDYRRLRQASARRILSSVPKAPDAREVGQ